MRIVSLLPSATEIVCALGLGERLVGVTHECDYPAGVAALPHVTRAHVPHDASSAEIDGLVRERLDDAPALYELDRDTLQRLRPDLIVTQALCDVCAVADAEVRAAACALPGTPAVVNLEPTCLDEVYQCIELVGAATAHENEARALVASLRARVDAVREAVAAAGTRPSVVVLEWLDPPFCCGHWSPEIVALAGGRELLGAAGQRSHTLAWDAVREADPEVLFIACCGFDVARTLADLPGLAARPGWFDLRAVRNDAVFVVDGSAYFSRPGPRLVDSLEIMAAALHPRHVTLPAGLPAALRLDRTQLQTLRADAAPA